MRTILAVGVLLGGVAAALLFRRPSPPADPPTPGVSERLVLRKQIAASSEAPAGSGTTGAQTDQPARPAAPKKAPAILTPMDPGQSLPSLARDYPSPRRIGTPRWGTSLGMAPPQANLSETTARTHRITDGDTLEGLAQRYLGSTDRAGEIYEANREVLSHPDILPIGAELKIPPRGPRTAPPSQPTSRQPLAPIPSVP